MNILAYHLSIIYVLISAGVWFPTEDPCVAQREREAVSGNVLTMISTQNYSRNVSLSNIT